jgi:hypothetical protein
MRYEELFSGINMREKMRQDFLWLWTGTKRYTVCEISFRTKAPMICAGVCPVETALV